MACEEYSQEVLGFSDVITSGNHTPYYDLIISTTSLTLTPFGDSDFLLEEVDAFIALEDDPTSSKVDQSYFESKGDILLLEAFLNDDVSLKKSNKNVNGLHPTSRCQFSICNRLNGVIGLDKLSDLARTPLNKHCSAVLLKKLPEKLGDLGKFLIPCDFPGMVECLAMADLGTSINLMPLTVWNKLSLPDLSPTFVDFDANPRVPLFLGRSFIKIERALIDVFEAELTLRVGKEAITFNLGQTSRYSANYNDMTAKQINVIDMACEEYSQEVLGFSD
nr:reverse transcriptase domain-containing protein [Tanacetum cinerariifolium]